jgi:hypothetical protein
MNPHLLFAAASTALVLLATTLAGAQETVVVERPYFKQVMPAPARAFELTLGTGYAQGFGTLEPGVGMPRVARAGAAIDASVGYRIDPHYAASLAGQYQELEAERDAAVRGFAVNLALQYHIDPSVPLDPWLEVGAGYRMLWLVPGGSRPTVFFQGPQLVRVRAGLDMRISSDFAVSPVIGADATMFVLRDELTLTAIRNPTLSTFVYAGLQGRFDIGID